jgi:hypothetical protein
MSRRVTFIATLGCVALGTGCGNNADIGRGPRETIAAWVHAVNAGDWGRACELSTMRANHAACEVAMRRQMDHMTPMKIVGIPQPDDPRHRFGVAPKLRKLQGVGWTAYPAAEFELEQHAGGYLVRFEVQRTR